MTFEPSIAIAYQAATNTRIFVVDRAIAGVSTQEVRDGDVLIGFENFRHGNEPCRFIVRPTEGGLYRLVG